MKMLNAVWASLATVTVMANSAMAATTAEEAAKLKTVLTPLGAERAGNADGSDRFTQVAGHRLAAGDEDDRAILHQTLHFIEADIGGDDFVGLDEVLPDQRGHRVVDQRFGQAAHFGDPAGQFLQLFVEGFYGMFDHEWVLPARAVSRSAR